MTYDNQHRGPLPEPSSLLPSTSFLALLFHSPPTSTGNSLFVTTYAGCAAFVRRVHAPPPLPPSCPPDMLMLTLSGSIESVVGTGESGEVLIRSSVSQEGVDEGVLVREHFVDCLSVIHQLLL